MGQPFATLVELLEDLFSGHSNDKTLQEILVIVQQIQSDTAAIKSFLGIGDQAAGITVNLGQPADKPQQ